MLTLKKPLVSVIIPLLEINSYIVKENLPAMEKQTYCNFEVIVLPNEKKPEDQELLKKYQWLKIIPTGKITRPALKRDIGVKNAQGEIIAFIDDDAYPDTLWLEKAVKAFETQKAEAVCGPGLIPENANFWEKTFDEVLKTPIGTGGYTYRFIKKKERYVDDYPSMNFLILKNVFEELGGFNNDYWPGEDSKLCNDLVYKKKGKILYHPEVAVYHHRRNDLKSFLKQHSNYGFHRGAFFAHGDANSRRLTYLMPTVFVLYLITLLLVAFFINFIKINGIIISIFLLPLILYLLGILYTFFLSLLDQKNPLIALTAPFVLLSTHLIYGIIFVKGYFKGTFNTQKIYD
ncbi:MAG: glycosyltransferase [Candidatus Roizmanbacteria bacterium]|nr:MAG: glycosyltransferase [Candidatus Roizmanbacteria bacterium]